MKIESIKIGMKLHEENRDEMVEVLEIGESYSVLVSPVNNGGAILTDASNLWQCEDCK